MSTLVNPVGSEPPGVYWRRRLAVLLVVLFVLFTLWLLFFRGGGSDGAAPAPSPSPSTSRHPTSTPTTAHPTTTKSSSAGPTSSPSSVGHCPDSAIGVAAATDHKSYPVGSSVKLSLTITNTGTVACTRDVGAKANTLLITSNGNAVWSSDDCNPGGAVNEVTMKPGDVYEVKLTWEGAVTNGSCPSNPPAAQAGAYDVQGRNGNVLSPQRGFALT